MAKGKTLPTKKLWLSKVLKLMETYLLKEERSRESGKTRHIVPQTDCGGKK